MPRIILLSREYAPVILKIVAPLIHIISVLLIQRKQPLQTVGEFVVPFSDLAEDNILLEVYSAVFFDVKVETFFQRKPWEFEHVRKSA